MFSVPQISVIKKRLICNQNGGSKPPPYRYNPINCKLRKHEFSKKRIGRIAEKKTPSA